MIIISLQSNNRKPTELTPNLISGRNNRISFLQQLDRIPLPLRGMELAFLRFAWIHLSEGQQSLPQKASQPTIISTGTKSFGSA